MTRELWKINPDTNLPRFLMAYNKLFDRSCSHLADMVSSGGKSTSDRSGISKKIKNQVARATPIFHLQSRSWPVSKSLSLSISICWLTKMGI